MVFGLARILGFGVCVGDPVSRLEESIGFMVARGIL